MKALQVNSRRLFSLSGVLLLITLAVGSALVLRTASAQEPVKPETATAAKNGAVEPNAGPAVSEEERQQNEFLHEGPVVKWTAKTFNLSLETSAVLFEVVNFAIIFFAIVLPLAKFLPRAFRGRKLKLREDLDSARKVSEEANSRLSAIEARMAKIDQEIQKFRAEVEAESKNDEARIKASIVEESARIVQAAEQEIAMAAAQAKRGLRHFAADLAIDQAARQLNLTPEIDRQLINEFVGAAVESAGEKGGK